MSERTRMFLNGTAMSGQADHGLVADARLLGPRQTAPKYRFVAVRDEFPGLLPVDDGGVSVTGELYEMSEELLRDSLLPGEPAELELGRVELADGEMVNAMRLRPERLRPGDKVVDIADLGGWRAYQAHLEAQRALPRRLGRQPASAEPPEPAAPAASGSAGSAGSAGPPEPGPAESGSEGAGAAGPPEPGPAASGSEGSPGSPGSPGPAR